MKTCHSCKNPIKPGAREWFVYRGIQIIGSCCSSGCFRAARAAMDMAAAPKQEKADPHQTEAFK